MKKFLSLLLVLTMIFALSAPMASAVSERGGNPVIYIRGNGEDIVDRTTNQKVPATLDDMAFPEGAFEKENVINTCANILLPMLTEGLLLDDWSHFGDAIYDEIKPLFEGAQLDGNGNSLENVGMRWESEYDNMTSCNVTRSSYGLFDYQFHYDWRLSPYDNVKGLNEYIKNVRAANGNKKVDLYVRCFGGSLGLAYLEAYGSEGHVESIMFGEGLQNGAAIVNDAFSGKIEFTGKRLQQYMKQLEQCEEYGVGVGIAIEGIVNEIVFKTLDLFTQTGTTDTMLDSVEDLYGKLCKALMPAVCLASGIATQANYWTCVYEEDFDEALEFIFPTEEAKQEYAGLITKINYYREHITSKLPEVYKTISENYGVKIGAIAKYGYLNFPCIESVDDLSDALVSLEDASLGATCAPIGSVLSEKYISSVNPKYISADKKVDTSTCMFPETTWIVKNAHHNFFDISDVIAKAFFFDGATADSTEVPRFLRYYEDQGRWEPMTEDNCADYEWYDIAEESPTKETVFASMIRWLKMIIEIITKFFKGELTLNFGK